MKDGWMRGAIAGTMVGASTIALVMALNGQARKKVMRAVTGTTQKMAEKANQILK
ncbi:MAG: hypothetical protein RSA12_05605 [Clostridia bacterium]